MLRGKLGAWLGLAGVISLCSVVSASGQEKVLSPPSLEEARARLQAGVDESGFKYSADTLTGVREDSILLRGNAVVTHRGAQLEAAQMVYHRKREVVEARAVIDSAGNHLGLPVFKRGEEVVRGVRILYNVRSGEATLLEGRAKLKKGFYAGDHIQVHSEEEFHVADGSYTTCDLETPHFDFYSPRIKVLPGDMAIARPVYLRVAEKPIFWVPFFVFSLREDRQSGILTPSFGRRPVGFASDQSEWEVRNLGYYFAPNNYWDLSLGADLRQRSGWLGRAKLAYALRYFWKGQIETRIENRQSGASNRWSWWTSARHDQELGPDASLRASGTFQSNKDFGRDNGDGLRDRLDRTLRSNLTYDKRWRQSGRSLSLSASQTKNLDTDRFDIVLPEVRLRTSRRALFGNGDKKKEKNWYNQIFYDGNARLRNTRRGTAQDTTTTTSADMTVRLSAQQKPLPWLSFNPSLTESWRDADLRSDKTRFEGVRTNTVNASAALAQTFYGLFHPRLGRVEALRHVIKPNLRLRYQASRTDTGGVVGFGGRGSPWKQSRRVDIGLDNSLWAKVLDGEKENKVRLIQLNMSTAYDLDRDRRPLSDLSTSLTVDVGKRFDTRLRLGSEFYDDEDRFQALPRLKRFEVSSSLRLNSSASSSGSRNESPYSTGRSSSYLSPYSGQGSGSSSRSAYGFESGLSDDIGRGRQRTNLLLSHYYARTRSTTRTTTRSWLRLGAGAGWRRWYFNYSLNYNLHVSGANLFATERITAELLSIRMEFHDWTTTFNMEPHRFLQDKAFYFKVQLKDIPQLKFERGDRRG